MRWHEKVGIGTAAFGMAYGLFRDKEAEVDFTEIRQILRYASKNKIALIDTAFLYRTAYPKLAKCLGNKAHRKVVYKIPSNHEIEPSDLLRLNKAFRYCLMHHHGEVMLTNFDDELKHLLEQQKKYKFEKLGVSVYCPQQLDKILDKHHFDIVQIPYSINSHDFDLEALKQRGCEVHIRSVFGRGELIRAGVSVEQCLDFVLESIDHIDTILLGVHNEEQLIHSVQYIKTRERIHKQSHPDTATTNKLRHA
jgi:aryl-alcohol dehydrogenase-like predicted oxidoreductase